MKAETVIGPVAIALKPDQPYAGIRLQTPFPGMFAVATRALKELRAWSKASGLAGEGPYFLRYYRTDMKGIMDIETGVITAAAPPDHPRIKPGLLPRGRYAALIYRGNGLRGNQALMNWGHETGTRFEPIDPKLSESYVCRCETYLTDWRVEPRKLFWDVELAIKIA